MISDELQEVRNKINYIMLEGVSSGLSGRERYERYKVFLTPEIEFVGFIPGNLNCAGYVLGMDSGTSDPEKHLYDDYEEISAPEPGGIYMVSYGDDWVHLGKVIDENTVISKWGWSGPVFIHPLEFYYFSWDSIQYFRKKQDVS